jgi:hypothetical protein
MPNLRIIFDNASDRAAITASSVAGTLVAANLLTDIKSDVWRSVGTNATISLTWASVENIGGVSFPFCNLTAKAKMRVRVYADNTLAVLKLDTGWNYAAPSPSIDSNTWGTALGANAYYYAGNSYATQWMSSHPLGTFMTVDFDDPTNPSGYIEAARIVCGKFWSPAVNALMGASISIVDTSIQFRTDSGDLLTDTGTRHRKQTFDLPPMGSVDRASMWNILWGNGMSKPLLFSLYPESTDILLEQSHQMYSKLVTTPLMSTPYFSKYSVPIDIEEI